MATSDRDDVEQELRRRLHQGDLAGVATMAIRAYGAELFGFLLMFRRDREDAGEVFSIFCERLWRDLPTYRGDGSFRAWAYRLARNSALNYRRDARRRGKRERALPEGSELSAMAE